jgi:hypothetical protein
VPGGGGYMVGGFQVRTCRTYQLYFLSVNLVEDIEPACCAGDCNHLTKVSSSDGTGFKLESINPT